MSVTRIWIAVGVAVTLSCASDPEPADAPGSGGNGASSSGGAPGAGGSAVGGATATGGSAPSSGGDTSLGGSSAEAGSGGSCEPGACCVVSHVEIPLDPFESQRAEQKVRRLGDRFLVTATDSSGTHLAVVSWQGVETTKLETATDYCDSGGCGFLGATFLAGESGGPKVAWIARGDGPGSEASFSVVAWDDAADAPVESFLFDGVYDTRTTEFDFQASRDGQRAVFVVGDPGLPGFAEIGLGGAIVGTPVAQGVGGAGKCSQVVPTDEAGAVSYVTTVDESELIWHLRELDADGEVALEADTTLPLGTENGFSGGCPIVVLGPSLYVGAWGRNDAPYVIASIPREGAGGGEPDLLELPKEPPSLLSGVLEDELLLLTQAAGESISLTRLTKDGAPGGPGYALPDTVVSTLEVLPRVVDVVGHSIFLTYGTESARVIEEVDCP